MVSLFIGLGLDAPKDPVVLGATAFVSLLASVDGDGLRQRLAGGPTRTGGGVLVGLGVFILLRQIIVFGSAIGSWAAVEAIDRASWIADLVVAVPLLLVVGVLLWRQTPLGYAAGPGLLFGYGLLALSLIPFFIAEARAAATPLDWGGLTVILAMAAICFVPFGLFVRLASADRRLRADE